MDAAEAPVFCGGFYEALDGWLRVLQAVGFFRVESCPTQAVLPLVGLAAEKVIRDRHILQAVGFFRVESCPTQAVLPLVGLAAEKVIRDRYILDRLERSRGAEPRGSGWPLVAKGVGARVGFYSGFHDPLFTA